MKSCINIDQLVHLQVPPPPNKKCVYVFKKQMRLGGGVFSFYFIKRDAGFFKQDAVLFILQEK